MQSEVRQATPSCQLVRLWDGTRVGRDSPYAKRHKEVISILLKPRCVARFTNDRADLAVFKGGEKPFNCLGAECQARGQLHQKRPKFVSQTGTFRKKPVDDPPDIAQLAHVRDILWNFDSKAERVRGAGRPSLIRRRLMRTVEGRVDLDPIEHAGISFKMAPPGRERCASLGRKSPSGGADTNGAIHLNPITLPRVSYRRNSPLKPSRRTTSGLRICSVMDRTDSYAVSWSVGHLPRQPSRCRKSTSPRAVMPITGG